MLELKEYQKSALLALRSYLEEARVRTPADAFANTVAKYPTDSRPQRYNIRWKLENTPYVCLRVPTGGGKTLLASYAIGIASDAYLDRGYPFAIWLVSPRDLKSNVEEFRCAQALDMHPKVETWLRNVDRQNVSFLYRVALYRFAAIRYHASHD